MDPAIDRSVYAVYRALLHHFGPQGWWPVTDPKKRIARYRPGSYEGKNEKEKIEICFGAILTQNTAWINADKALDNLRREQLINLEGILRIPVFRLARLLKPSGYYNEKARKLKDFVYFIANRCGGKISALFKKSTKTAREELMSVRGIGPETADSMLLYAGDKKTFVVDAYTRRFGERMGWFVHEKYEIIQRFFEDRLPGSLRVYNEYHALLVALAKQYCRKKTICHICVVKKICSYNQHKTLR